MSILKSETTITWSNLITDNGGYRNVDEDEDVDEEVGARRATQPVLRVVRTRSGRFKTQSRRLLTSPSFWTRHSCFSLARENEQISRFKIARQICWLGRSRVPGLDKTCLHYIRAARFNKTECRIRYTGWPLLNIFKIISRSHILDISSEKNFLLSLNVLYNKLYVKK